VRHGKTSLKKVDPAILGSARPASSYEVKQDLIPTLEAHGALVIYVDLWSDTQANPASLMTSAIAKVLTELQEPKSALLEQWRRIKGFDLGGAGFKFAFQLKTLGTEKGPTIAEALTQVVDQARTDVVLVIDEVQHALTSEEGEKMLLALKAARDAVNPRLGTPGHLLIVGTGSHRAQVAEMTALNSQAFAGATSVDYPLLGEEYADYLLEHLRREGAQALPSLQVATEGFKAMGSRPEEMLKALRQLQNKLPLNTSADQLFPVIVSTIRAAAADVELNKVTELGSLATAVFALIASGEGGVRGVFSADALNEYARVVGREVTPEQVQRIANTLRGQNLIMRRGFGSYAITDPFVQDVWKEQTEFDKKLSGPKTSQEAKRHQDARTRKQFPPSP